MNTPMTGLNPGLSISVILANFNHGRYLERSVGALLAQEHLPSEILLIDDGSTDDSPSVMEELARRSSRIRIIRNPRNIGLVPTQIRALDIAGGDLIYLAAADDWVMPGFFAGGVEALHKYPEAGLYSGDAALLDGESGRPLGRRPPVMPKYAGGFIAPARAGAMLAYSDNWILTGAALIRKDALRAAGGLDPELESFADGIAVRKIALMRGIHYAPRVVMTWCVFSTGFSRSNALDPEKARHLVNRACRKIAVDPVFPPFYAERFRIVWRFATARLAVQAGAEAARISALADLGAFDQTIIAAALALSKWRLGPMVTLIWLWLRLRPYRLSSLALTALLRQIRGSAA